MMEQSASTKMNFKCVWNITHYKEGGWKTFLLKKSNPLAKNFDCSIIIQNNPSILFILQAINRAK